MVAELTISRDAARAEMQAVERRAAGLKEKLDGLLASETHWRRAAVAYQKERNLWKQRAKGIEENLAFSVKMVAELAEAFGKTIAQRHEAARLVLQFEEFVAGLKEERDEVEERVRKLTLDLAAALQDVTYHKDRRAIDAARQGIGELEAERDEARQQSQHWRVHAVGLQETVAELKERLELTTRLLKACDPSVGATGLSKGLHERERDRG